MNNIRIINHYDSLIDEDNDPVHDPKPLREYMNKWDGQSFIDGLALDKTKSVLEIGVGTGRLAIRTAPLCKEFTGIDLSPKTIERASQNLSGLHNVKLICGDFMSFDFREQKFDAVYSSLTFMHIKDKQKAADKAASILAGHGRFVLSIDKNPRNEIDTGTSRIRIYPDAPAATEHCIMSAGLRIKSMFETEFACVFIADKD